MATKTKRKQKKKRASKSQITLSWRKILQANPKFDPIATAGNCWFDAEAAAKAISFFSDHLCFIEGEKAEQPFVLELWQKSIIANAFGWKRPDGTRRFREVFIFVPRKNGKTPFVAGIINYIAFCDNEPGAQIYSSAGEREQAALTFRHASGMIIRNPELNKRCRIYKTYRSIEFYDGDTIYKALSADADTKHGLNAHVVANDELHIQPNRDLIDTLATSTASRRQPLILHTTTAGFDKHSICYEKYDYACKVRDGIIKDEKFLPIVYEIDEDDDWTDEKIWHKANPNLGVSVSLDYLRSACKEAQDVPAMENTFKRLHLNVWTEQETRWLSMDKWRACPVCNDVDLSDCVGFGGLDLSANKDITAYVAVFEKNGLYYVRPKFWIPADSAHEREKRDGVPYTTWAKQGFITMTPGNTIDYEFVVDDVLKDFEQYNIQNVAFDRFMFESVRQRFLKLGAGQEKFVSFGQGFVSISQPMKDTETLILSGKLVHNNNPVLTWMASNVAVSQDAAGNVKPDKDKSIEKIDGIVALIMAIGLMNISAVKPKSVYETRGAIILGR